MIEQVPNFITTVRIALVVPLCWFLWNGGYMESLLIVFFASVSDAVDGALARKFDWMSRFGAMADPLADKLLVGVVFIILMIQQHVPLWLGLVVLVRDLIILTGAAVYRYLFDRIEIAPTFVSKANTAMQFIMLTLVLVRLVEIEPVSEFAEALVDPACFLIVAVLSITSGVDYVIRWSHRAIVKARHG